MKNIVKILTALATIAGAVYIIATYGDKIVAWAQKIWDAMPKKAEVKLEADLAEEGNSRLCRQLSHRRPV